jgi:hypothetical protein
MTGRPPNDVTLDLPIDDEPLPSPGDVVRLRSTVVITDPDEATPRALAIFVDADGEEVAVDGQQAMFGPDQEGRLGVRGTVIGLQARADGFRLRISLTEPDGLALEDGRREVEVPLELIRDP